MTECAWPQPTLTRRVDSIGRITLTDGRTVSISQAFAGERLGFRQGNQHWLLTCSCDDLGIIPQDSLLFDSMEQLDG